MKKVFLLLIILMLVLTGCEYTAGPLPEKICITSNNLEVLTNGSGLYITDGQVEIQLKGCESKEE